MIFGDLFLFLFFFFAKKNLEKLQSSKGLRMAPWEIWPRPQKKKNSAQIRDAVRCTGPGIAARCVNGWGQRFERGNPTNPNPNPSDFFGLIFTNPNPSDFFFWVDILGDEDHGS